MNKRRQVVVAFGAGAFCGSRFALAQSQGEVRRIGFLQQFNDPVRLEAFRAGLRDLGYAEGRNIIIDYQPAAGNEARMNASAAEIVSQKVDVIVADGGTASTLAAMRATKSIPIVFPTLGDPVSQGIVKDLARPGGNVTGLSLQSTELTGKVLQLLREIIVGVKRVAFMVNPSNLSVGPVLLQLPPLAAKLGLDIRIFEPKATSEIVPAVSEIAHGRFDALVVWNDAMLVQNSLTIASLATTQKLPTMGYHSSLPESGGLASYGPDRADLLRRAAVYVDKILKGAKPGDLPVEQPTKFELVINVKTAKLLRIKIPQSILVQATKVID